MSRGKLTIAVFPVSGSTLTTRSVSVREWVRSSDLSMPVSRTVIRFDGSAEAGGALCDGSSDEDAPGDPAGSGVGLAVATTGGNSRPEAWKSDQPTATAQRWVTIRIKPSRTTTAFVGDWRTASRPRGSWDACRREASRHAPSATTTRMKVTATAGTSRSMIACSTPLASQTNSARKTTATGIAKIAASRGRPAYHWPSPGHRNESVAATEGDGCEIPRRVVALMFGGV